MSAQPSTEIVKALGAAQFAVDMAEETRSRERGVATTLASSHMDGDELNAWIDRQVARFSSALDAAVRHRDECLTLTGWSLDEWLVKWNVAVAAAKRGK